MPETAFAAEERKFTSAEQVLRLLPVMKRSVKVGQV